MVSEAPRLWVAVAPFPGGRILMPSAWLRLFRGRSPAAVLRRVIAVIVDAVECVPGRRAASHISQEVLEVQPASANLDAAPTIAVVASGIRIDASLLHRVPRAVFRCRWPSEARIAVANSSTDATGSAFPHRQIGGLAVGDSAASTLAGPDAFLAPMSAISDDCQPTKTLAEKMLSARHSHSIADNIYTGKQEGGGLRRGG